MGYLAFDRGAVESLRLTLQRALDDLRATRITDPAAEAERRSLEIAARRLDPWLSTLAALGSCAVLEGYRRIDVSQDDLPLSTASWVRLAGSARMELFTDPLGDAVVDPVREAIALADALRAGDLGRYVDDDDQVVWLEERLALVAASSATRGAFVERLGTERLVELADRLATRQRDLDMETPLGDPRRPSAEHLASVLGLVGRILQGYRDDGGSLDVASIMAAMSPVAAAQCVAGMVLESDELAALAHAVLKRWWTQALPSSVSAMWNERSAGDVILPIIAQDQAASRLLMERSLGELHLVFRTSRDKWWAEAVTLNATDPAYVTAAQAGPIVPAVLTYLRDHHSQEVLGHADPPDYDRAWLGALAGGWLPELTSRRSDWGLSAREAADAIAFVLEDADALRILAGHAERRLDSILLAPMDGGRGTQRSLEELSGMLGTLNALIEHEHIEDAEAARALWDLGWTVAGITTAGLIGMLNLPAGVGSAMLAEGVDEARGGTLSSVKAVFERRGWLGAPPDEATVKHDAARHRDETTARQAAAVVSLTFGALVEGRRVPADAPAPPKPMPMDDSSGECTSQQYLQQLRSWSDSLNADGTLDAEAARVIDLAINTMLNPGQAAGQCVQVYRPR